MTYNNNHIATLFLNVFHYFPILLIVEIKLHRFFAGKFYHVPYRQSRLTMLMKDAFEVESHRRCKTVVFANVSPSVADMSMTINTLRLVITSL